MEGRLDMLEMPHEMPPLFLNGDFFIHQSPDPGEELVVFPVRGTF